MDLYRSWTDVQFGGNYFIGITLDQQVKYLPFTFTQVGNTGQKPAAGLVVGQFLVTLFQGRIDCIYEGVFMKGLLDKISSPKLHRLHGDFYFAMGGHDDDWQPAFSGPQLGQ